jgi:hypothetical protein
MCGPETTCLIVVGAAEIAALAAIEQVLELQIHGIIFSDGAHRNR